MPLYAAKSKTQSLILSECCIIMLFRQQNSVKGKGKAEHLYSALHGIQTTLKRSGMDHTVLPAINTIPA